MEDDPVHDAAIAKAKSGVVCSNVTPEGVAITGSAVVATGAPVTKRGGATHERRGAVTNGTSPNVNNGARALIDQLPVQRDDLLDQQAVRIFQIQGEP